MNARQPIQNARDGAARLVGRSGLADLLLKCRRGASLTILTYHQINDDPQTFGPRVSTAHFDAQMEYLRRHFEIRQLQDLMHEGAPAGSRARRFAAVTFDDGFRDVATQAYPILRRLGIPASVYVAADAASSGRLIWSEKLYRILRLTTRERVHFAAGATSPTSFDLSGIELRRAAAARIVELIERLSEDERNAALDRLAAGADVNAEQLNDNDLMLRWSDLSAMDPALVEVGSHTLTHAILSTATRDQVDREIARSKEMIESNLKRPVSGFTYPNDGYAPWMAARVRAAGYLYACRVGGATNALPPAEPFALRRIHVQDWPVSRFAAEIGPYGNAVRRFAQRARQ